MARGTQHRKRRPQANARLTPAPVGPRRAKRPAWEDQLFFGKLRVHGKWAMLLMVVVFAGGFIFLGVGSGSTGIGQIVSNFFSGTSAGGSSLSSLEKKTQEHPKDAAAWLAYANKLQQKQQLDDAAQALTTYTKLKPRDGDALRQLAGIYLQRAQDWQTLYQNASTRTSALTPTPVGPSPSSKLGQALGSLASQLTGAVTETNSANSSNAYSKTQTYLSDRVTAYKQLAKLNPQDATTQLSLAQAADLSVQYGSSADTQTAIAAYKAFLKLAPDDSQAPQARQDLKSLQKAAGSGSSTTTKVGGGSGSSGSPTTQVINVP